ncbi:MAG: hypothetical protein HYU43_07670, partial [Armatimonadetes bacterium]|nr:hypothetical protein [Armatimonadota bacterium]
MKLQASHYWAAGSVAFSAAFLLCGYEFIRSSSNTLYKAAYGKEKLPVVMALMPLGVLAVLAIYGRVLSWLGARRTLFWSTLACGAVLAGCTTLVRGGWTVFTGALYIFREAYVVLLIEQYWSFLNSSLGEKEARKLNGPVTGIASVGGILGGLLVQALAERLGTSAMPFFAAVSLLPAAFLSDLGYARAGEPRPSSEEAGGARGHLGLKSLRASPVLGLLLTVIVSTQVVSTCLDLRFQGMLQDRIPEADRQTAFSGGFYAALNAAAAFLQFVAAPLVLSTVPLWTVL